MNYDIAETQRCLLVALDALSSTGRGGSQSQEHVDSIVSRCVSPKNLPLIPLALEGAGLDGAYSARLIVQVKHFGRLAEEAARKGADFLSYDAYDDSWLTEPART